MKKKVLVVDDNKDILYTIKKGLELFEDEFDITLTTNGNDCLDILKNKEPPDIVILDIMMPQMCGWELFAKIKQIKFDKELPIIFLTAKTDEFSKGFGKLGADGYITKPFDITELKERIDSLLKR